MKPSQRSIEIWPDFEGSVVDRHFAFVWLVTADVGQSIICWRGCTFDGLKMADDVVFVFEVEFEKPDMSIGQRTMKFRNGRCHVEDIID